MIFEDLGIIEYKKAWDYQQQLFDQTIENKKEQNATTNRVLFCEHPHVITMGKNSDEHNVLISESMLAMRQVSLFHIDRGGDVTYHGPGQLVGYPIFDLESLHIGLRQYIYNLEEVIIKLLAEYNIQAGRMASAAGVWLDYDNTKARKICAIGVRSSRFVTMHGFALNINTDLSYFSLINPCGFVDKGVTSMEKELGHKLNMEEVKEKAEKIFESIFI